MLKKNFNRFMKMVEQKKQAVEAVAKEQERIMKEQMVWKPGQDRELVIGDGCFELYKKKKASQKQARRYQAMLENDYPGNKIIITAFQTGLLKCVQHLNKERKKKKGSHEDEDESNLNKNPSSTAADK